MLAERRIAEELMDDPSLDPAIYRAVLRDLAQVNTVTLARRPTLKFLDRCAGDRRSFRLLDVGFGDGDMLRAIARWAERRGIEAELVGIDLNPNSRAVAQEHGSNIDYRTGDYADLAAEQWDCIISSLVAHHMSHEQLIAFLRFMEAHARRGWFVNDLHRHAVSYLGYPVLARLAGWHPIVRSDGQTSIARAYRPAEWKALLSDAGIAGAVIQRHFPFRLCVSRIH